MIDNTRVSLEVIPTAKTLHTACSCWHSLDTNRQIEASAMSELALKYSPLLTPFYNTLSVAEPFYPPGLQSI